MQKFLVLYTTPVEGLDAWEQVDPEFRKSEEEKMKGAWDTWLAEHQSIFVGPTYAVGKVKKITQTGIADTRNDLMLYAVVEAESHEQVADTFKNHPHLQIPDSSIEIMPINSLAEMEATQE
jgi:hypothetical protein